MASPDFDSPWSSLTYEELSKSLNIQYEEINIGRDETYKENFAAPFCQSCSVPRPPPFPSKMQRKNNYLIKLSESCPTSVPKETKQTWDKLFKEGCAADVCVLTENETIIPAHFIVLVRHYVFYLLQRFTRTNLK